MNSAYKVEAGMVLFAGKIVWSISERFWVSDDEGAVQVHVTFTFLHLSVYKR